MLVSVVMANYNYGCYLPAAMRSVLSQTLCDLELIVVDDGSTDDSLQVLEPFRCDPRVRVVRVDHLGQPRAKNAGIAAATAPFIAFLDADDIWHADKLQLQMKLFEGQPKLGVVYSRRTLIDESGLEKPYRQPELHRGDILEKMFQNNFVCFSSAVVRREVFERVGTFDESLKLAIDYDLWLRVATHYEFDFVDQPLVQYRVGHANLSRRVGERLKTALSIMQRFLHEQGGRERIAVGIQRRAFAETYFHLALALRPYQAWQSGRWLLRSIANEPGYRPAWRGLLALGVPAKVRSLLRRGPDWEKAYRCPENDPKNT